MTENKLLIKKKCKACGNVVICARKKQGTTPSPESCNTCKNLGVEKAIEQRLMCVSSGSTKITITDAKRFKLWEAHKKERKNVIN